MRRTSRGRGRFAPPCSSLHPDDGVDPRRLFSDSSSKAPDRKTLQLCGQVARLLALALAGALADETLADLVVVAVLPAPDATRLRVVVRPGTPDVDPAVALTRLAAAKGLLRSEVAAGIQRRKAPDLVFSFAGPESPS